MKETSVKLVKIGEAAKILGVSIDTLRRWEASGKIQAIRTPGGTRLYSLEELQKINPSAITDNRKDLAGLNAVDLRGQSWRDYLSSSSQNPAIIINVPAREAHLGGEEVRRTSESHLRGVLKSGMTAVLLVTSVLLLITLPKYLLNLYQRDDKPSLVGSLNNILAETTTRGFLQVNGDVDIRGIATAEKFNGLSLTPSLTGFSIATESSTLTVTGDVDLDQPLLTTSSPTLANLTTTGTVTAGNVLNFGKLSTEPTSTTNGASYYNSTSNKFRCYQNGSWKDCDTDTTGTSFSDLTLAATSGTSQTIGSGNTITIAADNGITTTAGSTDTVTIGLDVTTTSTTTTVNANSGLETASAGLSLLRGCADGEALKWDSTNVYWECGSAGGSFTLAGDSGTSQTISGSDTLTAVGGTNGIDTVASATDTITLNLDTTEIGTSTFGSGSTLTWTFDVGATDPTLAFASNSVTVGSSVLTVSGSADGTDALVLTAGDILISNGDLDLSGGDFNVTLDGGDGASISNSAATADAFTSTLTGVGSDAIQITLTQSDDADATDDSAGLRLAITSSSGDADLLYGIDIGNITEGTATEVAFRIGSGWTNLIEFEGATDNGFEAFLQITDPTADRTYTLPNDSGEICLVAAGNCAGSGTGVTTAGGTANTLAKFTGSQAIGNTTITDDGSVVTFSVDADFTFAAGENLSLTNTTASTDQLSLSVSGVTTNGANVIALAFTQADDADALDTNSALNIAVTSSSGDADTLNGILVAAITAGSATEHGLHLGSGWDNNLYLNDTTSRVLLADGGTIVIHDGTNTLCTITDNSAVGDLTCTGSISGGSSGTQGYWSRTSTTLSPATSNDIVSISSNTTSAAILALTSSGATTDAVTLVADSVTTGDVLDISADGLTTGRAAYIQSTSTAGGASGASYLMYLDRSGANSNSAHTAYGVYSAVSNTGTTSVNVAGYFSATGAVTNRGVEVAAMTGATSTGLTIGALSGTTADTGISIGAISGTGATGTGITVGNISTTGADNRGITLGTMTGGTSTNYQINTGTLTSIASSTNYHANLGATVGASSATFGAINTGAISGSGTQSAGIVLGANSATATTNYGITVGAISGAGTTNTGLNIAAVSGATNNYAIKTAQGSVDITDNSNTVASLALTNNTATTIGAGVNTLGVIDVSSTSLTTGNLVNLETTTTLSTGKMLNISSTSTALTTGNLVNLDWSPGSAVTNTATGDLLKLTVGANGANNPLNYINFLAGSTSVFSASQQQFTTSLPSNFTAAGDLSIAYDINFTNPTISYIKSIAPITIQAGEIFNSSNISLKTFNQGSVFVDSAITTGTGLNVVTDGLTTGDAVLITSAGTSTTTGSLLNISSATTGAVNTSGLVSINATGAYTSTSNNALLNVTANTTQSGTIQKISGTALRTGVGLLIAGPTTGTTFTTGSLLQTTFAGTGAIATNGIINFNATGNYASTSNVGLLSVLANSTTAGTIQNISGTALTTGTALYIAGPTSTGVISGASSGLVTITSDVGSGGTEGSLLYLAPDFSAGSATTGNGLKIVGTDATAIANTSYGSYGSLALTGNAAKTGVGNYQTVTSSSTTGDTLVAFDAASTVTGIIAGATTRSVYGLRSQPTAGAESTAGTTNVYGGYFNATGDVAAGGTFNAYGAYIANGTYDTDGTSTAIGIALEPLTGADEVIGLCFDCDTTFGTQTAATGIQWGNETTTTQNLQIFRSNAAAAAQITIQDEAGTDIMNGSATTFQINLSAQIAGTAQRLCHGGADASTGVETVGDCVVTDQADLAEYYGSDGTLQAGDVVTADPTKEAFEVTTTTGSKTSKAYVVKSDSQYQNQIIGIVSTNPFGEVLGGSVHSPSENPVPVALAGRVPVKVSNENGPIEPGDYLTSSSFPGVAMKATRPGPTVGKALESFDGTDGNTSEVCRRRNTTSEVEEEVLCGKIMAFVNVTFADPKQALANLLLDEEGNLVIPKLKTASIQIDPNLQASSPSPDSPQPIDLVAKLHTIDEVVATQSAQLAEQKSAIDSLKDSIASLSADLAGLNANTSDGGPEGDSSEVDDLNLTPPEILLATGSATLVDLKAVSAKIDKLDTLDLSVSNAFKVFGETTLGKTTIAGDLTVDGTTAITGTSLTSLPILYLQNSTLAEGIDIFNGKLTINKEGKLVAEEIEAKQFSITDGGAAGKGTITKGQTELIIENQYAKEDSIIILTPTTLTSQILTVVDKVDGGFLVEIKTPELNDITFDYLIIGTGRKVSSN